jgi:hypothetical protein
MSNISACLEDSFLLDIATLRFRVKFAGIVLGHWSSQHIIKKWWQFQHVCFFLHKDLMLRPVSCAFGCPPEVVWEPARSLHRPTGLVLRLSKCHSHSWIACKTHDNVSKNGRFCTDCSWTLAQTHNMFKLIISKKLRWIVCACSTEKLM